MNELKPEDVMKALENCSCCEGNCLNDCPLFTDTECYTTLSKNVLYLLREKDEELAIAKNERDEARRDCAMAERNHFESAQSVKDLLTELQKKDAEIERLTINMNSYGLTAKNLAEDFADYQADVQMEIADARAEAITEFAERMEKTLTAQVNISSNEMLAACMWCLDLVKNVEKKLKGATDGKTDL